MIQHIITIIREWRWRQQQDAASLLLDSMRASEETLKNLRCKNASQLPGWTPDGEN
tara:strand:+ start:353 stop:520 length:168 start_codon:yes stop_codon:yes gene_type:complete